MFAHLSDPNRLVSGAPLAPVYVGLAVDSAMLISGQGSFFIAYPTDAVSRC